MSRLPRARVPVRELQPGRSRSSNSHLLLLRQPARFLVEPGGKANTTRGELIQKWCDGGNQASSFGCQEDTDRSGLWDSERGRDVPPPPFVDGCRCAKLSCQGEHLTLAGIQPEGEPIDHRSVRDLNDTQPLRSRDMSGSRQALVSRHFSKHSGRCHDIPEQLGQKVEPADSCQRDQWTGVDDDRHVNPGIAWRQLRPRRARARGPEGRRRGTAGLSEPADRGSEPWSSRGSPPPCPKKFRLPGKAPGSPTPEPGGPDRFRRYSVPREGPAEARSRS